jgi:hypothetical protein
LIQGLLNLLSIGGTVENLNYVFIGDEAFPLHKHVLKLLSQRDVNHHRTPYSYRIYRERNTVENTFRLRASRCNCLQALVLVLVKLFMLFSQYVHYTVICDEAVLHTLFGHLIEKICRLIKLNQMTGEKKITS